jgi:hypothetical protein
MPPEVLKQMTATTSDIKHCVTPEQAANPQADFLSAQKGAGCSYDGFSMAGGRIKGSMNCSGSGGAQGKVVMNFDGRYDPRSYDMTSTMQAGGDGMNMTIKSHVTGKRVGECTAETAKG